MFRNLIKNILQKKLIKGIPEDNTKDEMVTFGYLEKQKIN
jgi:hypothetical protein